MHPDNTRPPEPADASDGFEDESKSFDPGDSFSNEPSDIGDPGELPSWLRNFAGSTGEPSEPAPPDPGPRRADASAPSSWELPDAGLSSVVGSASGAGAVPMGRATSAGDDVGFFSEDDLPEWLRALSLDNQAASDPSSEANSTTDQTTQSGRMSVPQISRAWVTPSDVPEVSVGANLLSSLVTVVDSRPDVVPVEAAGPAASGTRAAATAKAPTAKSPASSAASDARSTNDTPPVVVVEPATTTSGGWSRTTILLIVAIIILLILLILFLS